MKVKVTAEFNDKHTGELHRSGDILDLNVQRINEILLVGSFIELVEQSESEKEETEQTETAELSPEGQEESKAAGEGQEETPKQTTRRKRNR